ncbi:MAG: AAA family ATPase [Clostridia bacterium]|nr:AAA family ATPase [Clostridia bacterium]
MLIIVSGSAGVGKNTVITEILKKFKNVELMKTCTTRAKRSTDESMQSPYIYLSKEEFESKIKNGELFEHEEIHQNFYGVLNSSLDEIAKKEKHYIKDIGVLGQQNIKRALEKRAHVLSIFLTAPKDELIARLKKRGDHDIDLRISRMEFELEHASNYDVVIENLNLEKTIKKVESLIKKHEKLEQKEFPKTK